MCSPDPLMKDEIVQRIHDPVMRHEQNRLSRMFVEPPGQDADRPCLRIRPLFGIRRQAVGYPLADIHAELALQVIGYQPFKAAEIYLSEVTVDEQRLFQMLNHYGRGLERTNKRTADDHVDATPVQDRTGAFGLRDTVLVQRNIGMPREAPLTIPVGLAVTKEVKGSFWNGHLCNRSTWMRIRPM